MNDKEQSNNEELTENEGLERLNDKIKQLKKKQIVPPIDAEEPTELIRRFVGSDQRNSLNS